MYEYWLEMSVFGFAMKNAEIIQVTWANVQAANV